MPATFCNEGVERAIRIVLGNGNYVQYLDIRLFVDTNPVDPTDTFPASHTECSLSGYSPQLVLESDWTIVVSAGVANASLATLQWDFDPYAGGVTIYGFWVTLHDGSTSEDLLFFEKLLDTPFAVPALGGTLKADVTFSYGQCA